jgi:hypothetical protein
MKDDGSALPRIVGRPVRRLPGDRGDELAYGNDGTLVIRAGAPVDGAEPNTHRPTLFVVDDVHWRLVSHTRDGPLHVYALVPWQPGPYEREGLVIPYDPERVHHARVEQLSLVLRTVLWLGLLPVAPLLGLLPEDAKKWLGSRGLLPPASQTSSLVVEWLLMYALAGAAIASFLAGSLLLWIAFGAAAFVVGIDIPYRITMLAEARDVGVLAWPREFVRTLRQRLPDDDVGVDDGDDDDHRPALPPSSRPPA